jgi:hypothetical protein
MDLNKLWINRGRTCVPVNPTEVQKKTGAVYLTDVSIRTKRGDWSEEPVQIYYQKTPPKPEYSNYFGIFVRDGHSYITDGSSILDKPLEAMVTEAGEVIFSRYRHDFRYADTNQSLFVDGGRDYLRCSLCPNTQHATIEIVNGQFHVRLTNQANNIILVEDVKPIIGTVQ